MIAGVIALALLTAPPNVPQKGPCKDSLDVAIFTSPRWPNKRVPLTVMITSERPLDGTEVAALDPKGELHTLETVYTGGPPYSWMARIKNPRPGRWRIGIGSGEVVHACQRVRVKPRGGRVALVEPEVDPVWESRIKWERDTENLYSMWIEHLFEAPNDEQPSWRPVHEVLRNPEKNLLYNHLNLGEDGPSKDTAVRLKPDCADFPYHLRAYFAWKLKLPFAFRSCRRGTVKRAPRCSREYKTNMSIAQKQLVVRAFQHFAQREVGGTIHSSSPRTPPKDERSDFYPVKLTRRGVRPGAIFADPYGHILVVQKWVPQQAGKPGILFGVDAQPDKTVGRRRFWRGSFLFPEDDAVSGAGFKRFRPVWRKRDGEVRVFSNERIANSIDYGDYSLEQWENGKDAFYERMDALINPVPMSPKAAFDSALDALQEQIERRVLSVNAAEAYKAKTGGRLIDMPERAKIFQTAGAWEDYSTPSRDLRLLIAIQTVVDYPRRVVKYTKRFILPEGMTPEAAQKTLEAGLMADAAKRTFEYTRTDGSKHTLSVADVLNRRQAMEMAYNPNDCPEVRWAAPKDSDEYATCRDHAPEEQVEKMRKYRVWFKERRRPID